MLVEPRHVRKRRLRPPARLRHATLTTLSRERQISACGRSASRQPTPRPLQAESRHKKFSPSPSEHLPPEEISVSASAAMVVIVSRRDQLFGQAEDDLQPGCSGRARRRPERLAPVEHGRQVDPSLPMLQRAIAASAAVRACDDSHNLNDAAASVPRLDQTRKREKHARGDSRLLSAGERRFRSVPYGFLGRERASR